MKSFLTIVGVIVVAWILLGVIGAIVGFLVKTVLWIALIAGGVYLVGAITAKARQRQVRR